MNCKYLNGTHTVMQSEINIGASSGAFLNASLSKSSFFVSVAIVMLLSFFVFHIILSTFRLSI